MGTKTLSVSDEAYARLRRLKRPKESFSDVILRLTGREDLLRFAGSISSETAARLRTAAQDTRRELDEAFRRRNP